MNKFVCIISVILLTACTTTPQPQPPTSLKDRVLHHYSYDNWHQVTGLAFDFNVALPNGREVSRAWVWHVDEQIAILNPADPDAITIDLTQAEFDEDTRRAHGRFINDTYWLLYPFYLEWGQPQITEQPANLDDPNTPNRLIATHTTGGYTPGDTYELDLNPEGQITAWTFVRNDNRRPATWEHHIDAGPIRLALDHHGPNNFRLHFTNVRIRLQGEQDWHFLPDPE
ncbi:hypothetical protein [Mucisphaera sp.]|uniref:hypothetical protein n=1 Tax=Mucisphaera sp. TaxID=2913024 RepID=UPI003D104309